MLFGNTKVTSLFGFENKRGIFEGVHKSFKFVVLTFERGGQTEKFSAAFMRHDVAELEHFRQDGGVLIDIDLVKRSSPSSLSVTEFKNALDVQIVEKMLEFPLLGDELPDTWNVKLFREFDMTNDSDLFHTEPGLGRLPLYEGKMIWQFSMAMPRRAIGLMRTMDVTACWADRVKMWDRHLGIRRIDWDTEPLHAQLTSER